MTDTRLYEDNAGGLTIIHGLDVYTGIEHVTDATFAQLAAILRGELEGDMAIPDSDYDQEEIEHWSKLIAIDNGVELEMVGRPGVAAKLLLGLEDSEDR